MQKPMTDREYVNACGGNCPYCRSRNLYLQEDGLHQGEGTVRCTVECHDCGCEWDEVYELCGWAEIEEN